MYGSSPSIGAGSELHSLGFRPYTSHDEPTRIDYNHSHEHNKEAVDYKRSA